MPSCWAVTWFTVFLPLLYTRVCTSLLMSTDLYGSLIEVVQWALVKLFCSGAAIVFSPIGSIWECVLYVLLPYNVTIASIKTLSLQLPVKSVFWPSDWIYPGSGDANVDKKRSQISSESPYYTCSPSLFFLSLFFFRKRIKGTVGKELMLVNADSLLFSSW